MSAAPVSPLERQQLESARAARATYWHRARFELVGREALRLGATGVLDIGAGAGLLGVWVASNCPRLEYRFEETSPVLRDHLVARRCGDPTPRLSRPAPWSSCSTCSSTSR
jgi:hypothetical protein